MIKTKLADYNNDWYYPGAGSIKRTLWYFVNAIIFNSSILPINSVKISILKVFGAKIGKNVTLKPSINIKYPWFLEIGNDVWIGENVWIDNLVKITIMDNCCISQGAMLLTGNHNFKKSSFDLVVNSILIEEGVWIGAKATVCPGVKCHSHAVLTVNSVATTDLQPYTIYQGNPAKAIKTRNITEN